jgi:hypothetical protein
MERNYCCFEWKWAHNITIKGVFHHRLQGELFAWFATFQIDEEQINESRVLEKLLSDMAVGKEPLEAKSLRDLKFFEFARDAVRPSST